MPTPDFSSIVKERIFLPFSSIPFLRLTFSDPQLRGIELIVIEDSRGVTGSRLTTVVARFYRGILAELNTHRVFGRNSASSRARSVKATVAEAMTNPYIPIWTINQKGMAGNYASAEVAAEAERVWLKGRDAAVATLLGLLVGEAPLDGRSATSIARDYEAILDTYYSEVYSPTGESKESGLSIHKQVSNRVLEPYLYHEAIITSSYWDNFLALRDHDDADPAIHGLAALIAAALDESTPVERSVHLPFVSDELRPTEEQSFSDIYPVVILSGTECAQVSYRDKSSAEASTATVSLGERLLSVGHLSPFEHQAFDRDTFQLLWNDNQRTPEEVASNLAPEWVQARPVLAGITK